MNFRFYAKQELEKIINDFPDYSVSEILFTVLKRANPDAKLSWLFEMDDRQLISAIENARELEIEQNEITDEGH